MMKTLLIVFAVLLFLLTLLSSFGGSIRPAEPFYDPIPAMNEVPPPASDMASSYMVPNPPNYDTFVDEEQKQQPPPPSMAELLPSQPAAVEKLNVPEPFVDAIAEVGAPY